MKRATRFAMGSVVYDKRRRTWNLYYYDQTGKRHSKQIGKKADLPTKSAALRAAALLQRPEKTDVPGQDVVLVRDLVAQYLVEKAPTRRDTRRSYEVWLRNHILPRWGDSAIGQLQPRPVELWLQTLMLSPKSRMHVRGLISILWDFGMWRGSVPTQRNPMELVSIRGATKRTKKPRSLSIEEAQRFVDNLQQPFREMAILCLLLGLRISECLALRWSDVDSLNYKLRIERSIVNQNVDEVKTTESRKQMPLDGSLIHLLQLWKQASQFPEPSDWMFASPTALGRQPWSYDAVWRVYQKAAKAVGLGNLGTHALRHTYRSWLDAVGTPIAVQQKLMRHADIRTTMNIYGDIVTNEESEALAKIARFALPNSTQTARSGG